MKTHLPSLLITLLLCFTAAAQLNMPPEAGVKDPKVPNVIKMPHVVKPPITGLSLESADVETVLGFYAELTGRTVLRPSAIGKPLFTLSRSSTNRAELAGAIEKALADKGIATIPDGDKFVMIVPQSWSSIVKPNSPPATNSLRVVDENVVFPPGTINFPAADLADVAKIYSEIVGKKLDRQNSVGLMGKTITLKSQNALTKEQIIYAMETLFAWQGIKMVPSDTNSIKAVAIQE